jgi:putative transposase
MPRRLSIDAAGALHHIMARGIDRCEIFRDNTDRDNFLDRLGESFQRPRRVVLPGH